MGIIPIDAFIPLRSNAMIWLVHVDVRMFIVLGRYGFRSKSKLFYVNSQAVPHSGNIDSLQSSRWFFYSFFQWYWSLLNNLDFLLFSTLAPHDTLLMIFSGILFQQCWTPARVMMMWPQHNRQIIWYWLCHPEYLPSNIITCNTLLIFRAAKVLECYVWRM